MDLSITPPCYIFIMSHLTRAHQFSLSARQPSSHQALYVAGSQPNTAYGNSPIHSVTVVQAAHRGFPLQVVYGAPQQVMHVVHGAPQQVMQVVHGASQQVMHVVRGAPQQVVYGRRR